MGPGEELVAAPCRCSEGTLIILGGSARRSRSAKLIDVFRHRKVSICFGDCIAFPYCTTYAVLFAPNRFLNWLFLSEWSP